MTNQLQKLQDENIVLIFSVYYLNDCSMFLLRDIFDYIYIAYNICMSVCILQTTWWHYVSEGGNKIPAYLKSQFCVN